jgi:putative hemolysin
MMVAPDQRTAQATGQAGQVSLAPIDLRGVVEDKNPALAAIIPGFAYRLLGRLLHIRDINRGLAVLAGKEGIPFARSVCDFLGLRIVTENETVLSTARPLVVANHPLGGLDGVALISTIGRYHGDLVFPVNDFLMNIPNLRPCFVPVNKHGSNSGYARALTEAFASDRAVIHFPAGLCSRRKGHLIRDVAWQGSFVSQARRTGRPVIPTHVEGANSRRFYRVAWLRRLSGIKFNYEMLLLVDEMFRQRDQTLCLRFGPPIDPSVFAKEIPVSRWAAAVKSYVYALGRGAEIGFAEALERGIVVA